VSTELFPSKGSVYAVVAWQWVCMSQYNCNHTMIVLFIDIFQDNLFILQKLCLRLILISPYNDLDC
jgi:hypothetical protein